MRLPRKFNLFRYERSEQESFELRRSLNTLTPALRNPTAICQIYRWIRTAANLGSWYIAAKTKSGLEMYMGVCEAPPDPGGCPGKAGGVRKVERNNWWLCSVRGSAGEGACAATVGIVSEHFAARCLVTRCVFRQPKEMR